MWIIHLPSNDEQRKPDTIHVRRKVIYAVGSQDRSCSGGIGVGQVSVTGKGGLRGSWSCSFLIYVLLNKYVQFTGIFVCCFLCVHFPICRLYAFPMCMLIKHLQNISIGHTVNDSFFPDPPVLSSQHAWFLTFCV